MTSTNLIGIGLYTLADASRLLAIPSPKLTRWLQGYTRGDREYGALWKSQIDLGDDRLYLGFRDLMEARVANKFIAMGVPPIHIRQAIILARELLGVERPLSTNRFRTDGRTIFLQTIERDTEGREGKHLLNLFKRQYEFAAIIDPLLKDLDFDSNGTPAAWWPIGQAKKILVDPKRSFGQPIDSESGVPIFVLANSGKHRGVGATAKSYDVDRASVRRAMAYMGVRELRRAA